MTNSVPPTILDSRRASVAGPTGGASRMTQSNRVEASLRICCIRGEVRASMELAIGEPAGSSVSRGVIGTRASFCSVLGDQRLAEPAAVGHVDEIGHRRAPQVGIDQQHLVAIRAGQHQCQVDGGQGLAVARRGAGQHQGAAAPWPGACGAAWRPGGGTARSGRRRCPGQWPAAPATATRSGSCPGPGCRAVRPASGSRSARPAGPAPAPPRDRRSTTPA